MSISSFVSKSKSSVEQKSGIASSCDENVDCDVISCDNNTNGKNELDNNIEQKSASSSVICKCVDFTIDSRVSNPNRQIGLNENSSEHALAATLNNLDPNSPSSKLNSASASSSQSIAWGSKQSYYSITPRHSQQTSVSISNVDLGDSQTVLRSSWGSKGSQTNVSWQTSANNFNLNWTSSVTASNSSWGSKGSQSSIYNKDLQPTSAKKSNLPPTSSGTASSFSWGSKSSQTNIAHKDWLQKSARSSWGSKGSQSIVNHKDSQQTSAKKSNLTLTSSDTMSRFSWESKGSQSNAATNDNQQKSALYNVRSLGLVSCHNRKSIDLVNRIKSQRKVGVNYSCTSRKRHAEKLEKIVYTPMNDRDISSVIKGYLYLWKHLRQDNAYKIRNFI